MGSTMIEFDHAVVRVNDQKLAVRFYEAVFTPIYGNDQVTVEIRPNVTSTEQYLHTARTGGTGARVDEADQQRGVDRRGREAGNPKVRVVLPQGAVKIGDGLMPLFLARQHEQEPPPEQLRGTPRHAFPVTPQQLEKAIEVLMEELKQHPPRPVRWPKRWKDPAR